LQDLALCAFAAVDQEAVFVVHHHLGRKAAMDRRGGRGCAEEDDFKQFFLS
jgi:hypothetical protein